MTKKEIIETIKQEERAAYDKMREYKDLFGKNSEMYIIAENEWSGIYGIMIKLKLV